jgi:hypothetical protein
MNCAVHPEVEASGYCRNCGKAMCPACVRPVRDVFYCEDCLAKGLGVSSQHAADYASRPPSPGAGSEVSVPPASPAAGNPGIAFLLGFVPGLGAIYNGEYNKALIHIVVFGGIILGITGAFGENLTGFWIVSLVGFVFYMAIDALRTVKARQTGQPINDPLESLTKNRPVGPFILIAIGALFLMNNFGFFDSYRIRQIFWPAVLIGVGFLMLRNRMHDQN